MSWQKLSRQAMYTQWIRRALLTEDTQLERLVKGDREYITKLIANAQHHPPGRASKDNFIRDIRNLIGNPFCPPLELPYKIDGWKRPDGKWQLGLWVTRECTVGQLQRLFEKHEESNTQLVWADS